MTHKKTVLLLAIVLLLPIVFAGCAGAGREVQVDTNIFGNGNTSAPWPTFDGITDLDPFGTDAATPSLGQALAGGGAVQYQRVTCYDAKMNCEAARSIAPQGWQVGGQVYWAMQSGAAPATVDFFIAAPDGSARAGYISPMSYVVPDAKKNMADGQWYAPTLCKVKAYQNAQTYAQTYFGEYMGIANMQVVDVQAPSAQMAQAIQAYVAGLQQKYDALLAQTAQQAAAQNAQYSMVCSADAAQVTLRFEINGIPYKAKVLTMVVTTESYSTQNIPYYGVVSECNVGWDTCPLGIRYYMAQESRFDEFEVAADMFSNNLVENGQWAEAVGQVSTKLFQDQIQSSFEQIMQQQQALQQIGAQYVAQSAQNYYASAIANREDSLHNAMDGWTNVISEREYFEGADGAPVLLDSGYSHTYSDGSGGFVQSDSSLSMPSGWNEVTGSTMWP